MKYPDYPLSLEKLDTETCIVSDSDIPSGSGGINGERYTYGQLRHQPIIPELMRNITNSQLKHYAEECNSRNSQEGFCMFKVEGEYCFLGIKSGAGSQNAIYIRNETDIAEGIPKQLKR